MYLVSGAFILYLSRKNNLHYIILGFLLITSLITSARTGIVSFLVVFSIYNFLQLYKYLYKGSPKGLLLLLMNIGLLIGSVFLIFSIRGKASLSGSGRLKLNEIAFNIFQDNPIMGVGFGSTTYSHIGGMLPHNLFFQALAQGGIIYFVPLFIFIITLLLTCLNNNSKYFYLFILILFGAMLIPNILSSRFIGVVFLIFVLSLENNKNKRAYPI
ncbi:O-antigen ligase family protein [Lentibacillus cibarius]|uniref:O-antigen ligase-related domain-containing protein n=1 Tax=Lentibacillus cibarius TaxID=2583219 RepID=A0A5S3QJ24_9BACI|nr:O-antigen ligase family protein [Lentibacillus cibarius]TMN21932.1 hypothetical protein FFL34_07230 [Lentibacillus cibarius]